MSIYGQMIEQGFKPDPLDGPQWHKEILWLAKKEDEAEAAGHSEEADMIAFIRHELMFKIPQPA